MKHHKLAHIEKVKQCLFYSERKCDYGEELCCFKHGKSSDKQETTKLNCTIWNTDFKLRSDFMNHRKLKHPENVQPCRNSMNGTCEYISCWFKHTDTETENANLNFKNEDMTEKLFNMMEKIVQRLTLMENQIVIT